jgi:hypothetical protein
MCAWRAQGEIYFIGITLSLKRCLLIETIRTSSAVIMFAKNFVS